MRLIASRIRQVTVVRARSAGSPACRCRARPESVGCTELGDQELLLGAGPIGRGVVTTPVGRGKVVLECSNAGGTLPGTARRDLARVAGLPAGTSAGRPRFGPVDAGKVEDVHLGAGRGQQHGEVGASPSGA